MGIKSNGNTMEEYTLIIRNKQEFEVILTQISENGIKPGRMVWHKQYDLDGNVWERGMVVSTPIMSEVAISSEGPLLEVEVTFHGEPATVLCEDLFELSIK
jgi:hypothetical protein